MGYRMWVSLIVGAAFGAVPAQAREFYRSEGLITVRHSSATSPSRELGRVRGSVVVSNDGVVCEFSIEVRGVPVSAPCVVAGDPDIYNEYVGGKNIHSFAPIAYRPFARYFSVEEGFVAVAPNDLVRVVGELLSALTNEQQSPALPEPRYIPSWAKPFGERIFYWNQYNAMTLPQLVMPQFHTANPRESYHLESGSWSPMKRQ